MHKEKQGDMARTTSFMHIHEPPAHVTEVVQHRGRAVGPAGSAELIRQSCMLHNCRAYVSGGQRIVSLPALLLFISSVMGGCNSAEIDSCNKSQSRYTKSAQ